MSYLPTRPAHRRGAIAVTDRRARPEPRGLRPANPGTPAERGAALVVALLTLLIVSLLATTLATTASNELQLVANWRGGSRAFYLADGGAEAAFHDLMTLVQARGGLPDDVSSITPPPVVDGEFTEYALTEVGGTTSGRLPIGLFQGLLAESQEYAASVMARTTTEPMGRAGVELRASLDLIPIFQFAAFYEDDLEILPGRDMFVNGRLHTNSDMYLGSSRTLRIRYTVTAAGDIYNGRKDDGSTMDGDVEISDKHGNWRRMDGLDSRNPNWEDQAIERWDGTVRSQSHRTRRLDLAIPDPTDPHELIEVGRPGDGADEETTKIYYRAGLRILNGHGFDADGNDVSLIDPVTGTSAIRFTRIRDHREDRVMAAVEVDVEKLGRAPGLPANGIVYVGAFEPDSGPPELPDWDSPEPWHGYPSPFSGASDKTEFAVKLVNGSELPASLAIVTENPLYIHGDYNRTDKKAAAVMADAITVLSNAWGDVDGDGDFDDDLDHSELDLNDRRASETTINAAIMTGADVTRPAEYNGGLENLLRFLERWSGVDFHFNGSLVNLWEPVYATGPWVSGDPVYTPPQRQWSFDPDLLNPAFVPPGSPDVYTFRVTGWRRR